MTKTIRQIDAAIADAVDGDGKGKFAPHYHTDSAATDALVEALRKRGWIISQLADEYSYQTFLRRPRDKRNFETEGQSRVESFGRALDEAVNASVAEGWKV